MNVSVRPAHDVANDLNNSVVVKSFHLAHRFSQTCIPLFRRLFVLFGAKFGSSPSSDVDALISLMVIMRSNQTIGQET